MLKGIRNLILTLGAFGAMIAPAALPAMAYADTTGDIQNGLICGSNAQTNTSGGCDSSTSGPDLQTIMKNIINLFSVIVGFVAVIMIIIGGVKYITSGGDSGNISGAKNTIVYAVIGLIIVALAQVLVHFVLKNVTTS